MDMEAAGGARLSPQDLASLKQLIADLVGLPGIQRAPLLDEEAVLAIEDFEIKGDYRRDSSSRACPTWLNVSRRVSCRLAGNFWEPLKTQGNFLQHTYDIRAQKPKGEWA